MPPTDRAHDVPDRERSPDDISVQRTTLPEESLLLMQRTWMYRVFVSI